MDILEQIRSRYDSFGKTRRRICDFILNEPEQCCFCSLKKFAEQTDTTEVTVLNFCRAMGLDSYVELKKALQDYVIRKVNPGKRLKLAVAGSDTVQELQSRIVRAELNALQATFESNTAETAADFVRMIRKAERIFVAGHDFSRIPAAYLNNRLVSLGVDCTMLDVQDQRELFNRLSRSPETSLLIAMAVPPYCTSTVTAARYANAVGMPVAAITDRQESPLVDVATVSLFCRVGLLGTTNSFTPMMGLADLITMLYPFQEQKENHSSDPLMASRRQQFETLFASLDESQ